MFDEQNNNGVEDILASTEAPGTAQAAGLAPPPGPPSALAQGKLQPVQPGATAPVVPMEQLSAAGHVGFPVKKVIATAIVILVLGGGAAAGYFWWQGRSGAEPLAPSDMPLSQPSNQAVPPPAADSSVPPSNPLNQALDQLQQDSINNVLDPFSAPPAGSGNNAAPASSVISIDTDQDGLSDADEAVNGTNSRLVDSDADGLSDWEEVTVFGTNPLNSDTDSDNYTDGAEVQNGYSPSGPGKLLDFEKAKSATQ